MKIASIDVGSNTVLLLIAEVENRILTPLFNAYHSPRLGKGLVPGKNILDEKVFQLLSILKEYKSEIEKYNCEKIIITATNAMRIAANNNSIVQKIKDELDLDVEIIDGQTEAKYSYLGASSTIPNIKEKMVIDIGGGSTEIIHGIENDIKFKNSFQTGVVSLTEKFLSNFPYKNCDIKNAEDFLIETFKILPQNIPFNLPTVAVAGTPTTLSCINQNLGEYVDEKVEGTFLTYQEIETTFDRVRLVHSNNMIETFGSVVKGREDVLFAGILILRSIMRLQRIDRIIVSGRGLRFGSIINYII
ncbi:MAG: hypothetical protein H6610_11360 [Ignavibacteriales bacterium]|nr:hypothetical protein [Ignavibacteriales bacterium]